MLRFSALRLFFTSLCFFVLSYFGLKLGTIALKAMVSSLFGIDFILTPFWLKAISPASSGLWDFDSVYSIYSVEWLVPVALFLAAFGMFRRQRDEQPFTLVIWLWCMYQALVGFFGSLLAGAVAQGNVFHLLQWMYLPNHIIVGISIVSIPLFLWCLYALYPLFLKFAPDTAWLETDVQQRHLYISGIGLPLLAGAILILILALGRADKYLYAETACHGIAALFFLVYFRAQAYRPVTTHMYRRMPVYVGAALLVSCLALVLVWMF